MKKRYWVVASLVGFAAAVAIAVPLVRGARTAAAQEKILRSVTDQAALLLEAERANTAHDIAFERRLLESASGLPGSPEDGARIERRLAVLDWKYHARLAQARARLRAATEGVEPAEAWLALARLEQSAGAFDDAASAARRALESATTADVARRAHIAFGRAIVEKSIQRSLAGEPVGGELEGAFDGLDELVRGEPGLIEASRRLLQASLMLQRGEDALAAWRSYFHVVPGGPMPNAIADAGVRLEALLPVFGPGESANRRGELAEALADSRLFTEAALVVGGANTDERLDDPRVRRIVSYARLLRRWREITDEYYRLTALGQGSKSDYRARLGREASRLFDEAGITEGFDRDAPLEGLAVVAGREFGAEVRFGKTAGFYNLHMGHIVVDRRRPVEQYGESADVRFIMLDNIVSNGFQSWAWESGAQHGGWGDVGLIVQIRPVYAQAPLNGWRRLADEQERTKFREDMERESARDDARAREDPQGYLPGLAMRLTHQGMTQLLERLRADGLEGNQLRLAFVAELERVVQESSIFAHEGRHAIDAAGAGSSMRTWKKEFRAKLSEVAFAPAPRLALEAIFSPNIGSDTPHGRANAEIMKGLVNWMALHQGEIAGLDAGRPLLPQFDLLTDDQMREAFGSMDPLAGKDPGPAINLREATEWKRQYLR